MASEDIVSHHVVGESEEHAECKVDLKRPDLKGSRRLIISQFMVFFQGISPALSAERHSAIRHHCLDTECRPTSRATSAPYATK